MESLEDIELPDAMELLGLNADAAMDDVSEEDVLAGVDAPFTKSMSAFGTCLLV